MKQPINLAVFALAAAGGAGGADAQVKEPGCPGKPIRLVVTFAPGGTTDIQERSAAMGSIITVGTPESF